MKSRIGPISSSESALKATYGNVGGKKKFSPAAGFRPEKFSPPQTQILSTPLTPGSLGRASGESLHGRHPWKLNTCFQCLNEIRQRGHNIWRPLALVKDFRLAYRCLVCDIV